ncbi:hypothetical protein WA026_019621 [Henosepilachna vigintioctopunctata]|uniref:Uncharacterized protein n=1 Tax=Henosepilachna vigintioctopunctata TaxID=420089 RepID=A0AAW1TYN5_9CUCU
MSKISQDLDGTVGMKGDERHEINFLTCKTNHARRCDAMLSAKIESASSQFQLHIDFDSEVQNNNSPITIDHQDRPHHAHYKGHSTKYVDPYKQCTPEQHIGDYILWSLVTSVGIYHHNGAHIMPILRETTSRAIVLKSKEDI